MLHLIFFFFLRVTCEIFNIFLMETSVFVLMGDYQLHSVLLEINAKTMNMYLLCEKQNKTKTNKDT